MLLISYSDYNALGFSLIPEEIFTRYELKASAFVNRFTFGRVTSDNISQMNKAGICEIADIFYLEDNPQADNENKIIASFSNEGYSESYVAPKQASADTIETAYTKAVNTVNTFFTAEQRYRGVR